MSRTTAAVQRPEPTPKAPDRTERRLAPVAKPAPRRRPKVVYAMAALAGAAVIGAAQIGLSLAITSDSFVLADLTSQQRELDLQASALKDDLAGISSPQLLAAKAAELGLVVTGSASYLRLSDSSVVGANLGAAALSTVDPNGPGAVQNSLLDDELTKAPAAESTDEADEATDPNLPPPIADGIPSPTTR